VTGSLVILEGWEWTESLESSLVSLLKRTGMRVAMAVLKSWANAWTTSHRMHEDIALPCIFGCDASDTLSHYICCDPLWTAVISSSYKNVELLNCSPLVRLCLETPSVESARLIAIAFSCYHSLKLSQRLLVESGCDSDDFAETHAKLMSLADAFSRDIVG